MPKMRYFLLKNHKNCRALRAPPPDPSNSPPPWRISGYAPGLVQFGKRTFNYHTTPLERMENFYTLSEYRHFFTYCFHFLKKNQVMRWQRSLFLHDKYQNKVKMVIYKNERFFTVSCDTSINKISEISPQNYRAWNP